MSGTLNRVILIGRLGRDPELKFTADGSPVCKFSLATDESYTDRAGDKVTKVEWHPIVAWGKLAEICGQYLVKGKLVYVEGKIQTREWTDKSSGEKRRAHDIVARQMLMLSAKGSDPGPAADEQAGDAGGQEAPPLASGSTVPNGEKKPL